MRALLLAVLLSSEGQALLPVPLIGASTPEETGRSACPPLVCAPRILIVTATEGFRHDSIPAAEEVLATIAAQHALEVDFARDANALLGRTNELALYTAVFFVNTSGELPAAPRDALLAWVAGGGTFVGIHSAADTWHSSPEYIAMLGAEFETHPPDFIASIRVDDPRHPATDELPYPHAMLEEIYEFRNFDRDRVRLLLSLANNGHPLAWEKSHGSGRVLYTALGHRDDVWRTGWYQTHVTGIVQWAVTPRVTSPRRRAVRR